MKVAFLRSFTIEPVIPILKEQARTLGLDLVTWVGDFNTYAQDILNPESKLYEVDPDVVVLAVQAHEVGEEFARLVHVFRTHSNADLLIHTLGPVSLPMQDIVNTHLLTRECDYDERNWEFARLPFSAHSLSLIANDYLGFLLPLSGRIAKVLVVDLDNTLWDGVVGEGEIEIGPHPRALQRAILDLYEEGIILAICSKNNYPDAIEILEHHPSMLLRPRHFAAIRINWDDKVKNLKEIAGELNVGIDTLAFLDDSRIERERVRQALPEVFVIDSSHAPALRSYPAFQRLFLTEEDRRRGRMYAEKKQRDEAREALSLEEFYHSLETVVTIHRLDEHNVRRLAQLTQRTNQFNLTTRRYTEQELLHARGDVYGVSVQDRFGDSGSVGVAITYSIPGILVITTFLLSCRVIGRTIETAVLTYLAQQASNVVIRYIPTKKNVPVQDFLRQFRHIYTQDSLQIWELNTEVTVPKWITLHVSDK